MTFVPFRSRADVDGLAATAQFMDCGAAYDTDNTTGTDTIHRCEAIGINPNPVGD